jgi:hypothetical protein
MAEEVTTTEHPLINAATKRGVDPKLLELTEEEQNVRDAALEKLDRIKDSLKTTMAIRRNSTYVSPFRGQREYLEQISSETDN